MTTINDLAGEFNAQPYEVAAFADLGTLPHDAPLTDEHVAMIRDAWAAAPEPGFIDAVAENRAADRPAFEPPTCGCPPHPIFAHVDTCAERGRDQ